MAMNPERVSERRSAHLARLAAAKVKHGLCDHPLYSVWMSMKARCRNPRNPSYVNYGARGIRVCDEWDEDFAAFFGWANNCGWTRGLHLDRIDTNGHYSPQNCRFVTQAENNRNRRNTAAYTGRAPYQPTYSRPRTALTERDIPAIRSAAESGESHRSLAERYQVSKSLIGRIVRREQWGHI